MDNGKKINAKYLRYTECSIKRSGCDRRIDTAFQVFFVFLRKGNTFQKGKIISEIQRRDR